MTAAVKFNNYVDYLNLGKVNGATDVFKVLLTNTAPNVSTWIKYSDVTGELATSNGYTAGGSTVTGTGSTNSSGTETEAGSAITWTSNTGNMGPFRYPVLYDNTPTDKPLCEYWDYGSSVTLNGAAGEQFVWTPTGSAIYTLA